MNRRELEFHLQDLFDGRITESALESLQNELRDDPEARQAYREYLHLHHALLFRTQGVDLLNVVPLEQLHKRRWHRARRNYSLAVAALVALCAVVTALIFSRPARLSPPCVTFVTSPGTEFTMTHRLGGKRAPEGQVLEPGSHLELRRGTVELKFASGIRGIVRGPADLILNRADLLAMTEGTARFKVPPRAAGFKVSTADLVLTDLGTEFGIMSMPDFQDQVHIFTGKVELLNCLGLKTQELVVAGQARMAQTSGIWTAIPVRSDYFPTELPTSEPKSNLIVKKEFSTTQFTYAADVSASDLLAGLTPLTTGWNYGNSANPNELNDGIHGGLMMNFDVQGAWTTVGATAEYHLSLGANGLGQDITSVQSIADWDYVGFGNQAWTIEVKPVGGIYQTLAKVDYRPLLEQPLHGGGCTKVTLTDSRGVLARGIEFIRVTANPVSGSVDEAFVWRELDVFGTPTKPSSLQLR